MLQVQPIKSDPQKTAMSISSSILFTISEVVATLADPSVVLSRDDGGDDDDDGFDGGELNDGISCIDNSAVLFVVQPLPLPLPL